MRLDPSLPPAVANTDITDASPLTRAPLAYARPARAFSSVLTAAQQPIKGGALAPESSVAPWGATVRAGQTLSGIVHDQMAARGVPINQGEAMRLAQTVAHANNLVNADLIHPGQVLNLDSLHLTLNQALAMRQGAQQATASLVSTTQVQLQSRGEHGNHPVLQKTIDRAVDKGFIPARDKQAVMNKIVQMSIQHRFSPDDFARLTLMESDGMNPKATNNRCHGIIQFCDGPDRGAASVGFASNPRAILNHSVLQQLDMVDKYFQDTGLKNDGPVELDDLYLTVLMPAARNETRPNAALNIPGPQAAFLHVNRDMHAPITRNSILAGLHYNADERLRGNVVDVAQQAPVKALTAPMTAYAEQANDGDLR